MFRKSKITKYFPFQHQNNIFKIQNFAGPMDVAAMTQSRIKLLTKMADKHGCTLSQLAVAWCLRNSTSQSVIASANSTEQLLEILGSLPVIYINGILFQKLFWPNVRKKCFSDREKLLKFVAEGWEFAKFLRSLEQFIQTVKGQNNFW